MIDGAELNIDLTNGENISVLLSKKQLEGIIKLLGLQIDPNTGNATMLSDKGLEEFMDKTINKFIEIK